MHKTLILLILFFLSACSTKPFLDSRREVGKVGKIGESKPLSPVFCYNPRFNSKSDLQKMAQIECRKYGKEAIKIKDNKFSCTLFYPHKVYFECR